MFNWGFLFELIVFCLLVTSPLWLLIMWSKIMSWIRELGYKYKDMSRLNFISNGERDKLVKKATKLIDFNSSDLFTEDAEEGAPKVLTYWIPFGVGCIGLVITAFIFLFCLIEIPASIHNAKVFPTRAIELIVENPTRSDLSKADKFNETLLDGDSMPFIKEDVRERIQKESYINTDIMWAKYIKRIGDLSEAIK